MRSSGTYQPGRGFYGLRRSFRIIADEAKDRPAVDLVMGHENGQDMATHYVERISDERLKAVSGINFRACSHRSYRRFQGAIPE